MNQRFSGWPTRSILSSQTTDSLLLRIAFVSRFAPVDSSPVGRAEDKTDGDADAREGNDQSVLLYASGLDRRKARSYSFAVADKDGAILS